MNAQHPRAKGPATVVLGMPGRFYGGEIPDTICFVPLALVEKAQLNRAMYVAGEWASLNIKAQPINRRLGSHLFPDLKKPVADLARCEPIRLALERLHPSPATTAA
jgi:hypothetical protein